MNKVLQLNTNFTEGGGSRPGPVSISVNAFISSKDIERIIANLLSIKKYWAAQNFKFDPIVSVRYKNIVAKSNRISALLDFKSCNSNSKIVGAHYVGNSLNPQLVIVYSVTLSEIEKTIETLSLIKDYVIVHYDGIANNQTLREVQSKGLLGATIRIAKTTFCRAIKDVLYVDEIYVDMQQKQLNEFYDVCLFYKTNLSTLNLLKSIDIEIDEDKIENNLVYLNEEQRNIINKQYPFLMAMSVACIDEIKAEEDYVSAMVNEKLQIKQPTTEPVVGVIDSGFNEKAYFSEWVEVFDMRDSSLLSSQKTSHGTSVDSIIVDGPALNPDLDDNCGHFRVRHFSVLDDSLNVFELLKKLPDIIEKNRDIKVWNISIGCNKEVPLNYTSPIGALLDELQTKYDVIFVVAGTNRVGEDPAVKIGSPADSLNAIVVNTVDSAGIPAGFSRRGPVLSFFGKPDVAYYGGTENEKIFVSAGKYRDCTAGTSFAAPWITRKVAYLMHVMGFTKEEAKALILDAAASNNDKPVNNTVGFGVVPIKIDDILSANNSEIKFIVRGVIKSRKSFCYRLPVPQENNKFPYKARAMLCYMPACDINQGVDYTQNELNLGFGRVALNKQGNPYIKAINNDKQQTEGEFTYEHNARKLYRKWDNSKFIKEKLTKRSGSIKKMGSDFWGIRIDRSSRTDEALYNDVPFGLVVTLSATDKKNRWTEFVQLCQINGWVVHEVDIENHVIIYESAQQEIEFE